MKRITAFTLIACVLALCAAIPAGALFSPAGTDLNASPVAENLELSTFRSVPVSGTFKCLDPEGDSVTFAVVRAPKKGVVDVDGDAFVYTPGEGKKGTDTFTYAASDSKGNVSNEATVTVHIKKQKTEVTYSDMAGSPDAYAATLLAERGVFVGERVGGQYLFQPERTVSRGEFLVMCMKAAGTDIMDVTRTGFADDAQIPAWQKPYVTTAVTASIISGSSLPDGSIVFSPADPVTFAQAAYIINGAMGITDVAVDEGDPAAPAWAVQASANLSSCGILQAPGEGVSAAPVTRADAARLLSAAVEVLESRESGGLLGWLR